MKYQAIAANSKIYFGQDIPNMFVEGNNSPPKSASSAATDVLKAKLDVQWFHSSASAQDSPVRTCLVFGVESTELTSGIALQLVW